MTNLKERNYKMIERSLETISQLRRMLILSEGESEEDVDKFISEVGAREIEKTRNMDIGELMLEMMSHMMKGREMVSEIKAEVE